LCLCLAAGARTAGPAAAGTDAHGLAEPAAAESSGESLVHAQFETSAQAVEAGGKFLLAVRFQIPAEYRISWTNPGDVGQSTHVTFEVPRASSWPRCSFLRPGASTCPASW
jgi:DsbC/DsbD-like thiol-disulfide interchange protein